MSEQPTDDKIETWSLKFSEPAPFAGMNFIKADWLAEHGNGTVSWSKLNEYLKKLSIRVVNLMSKNDYANAKVFSEYVETVEKRLLELARKVHTLENAQTKSLADDYRGVWQPGTHDRGAVVTMAGSLWLCFRTTTAKPGAGDDWRLIVKRGADGKDLRP